MDDNCVWNIRRRVLFIRALHDASENTDFRKNKQMVYAFGYSVFHRVFQTRNQLLFDRRIELLQ